MKICIITEGVVTLEFLLRDKIDLHMQLQIQQSRQMVFIRISSMSLFIYVQQVHHDCLWFLKYFINIFNKTYMY